MSTQVKLTSPTTGPLRIPRDTYKVRIMEEPVFKVSSNKNSMLLFKFEIVSPETLSIDGETRKIAGSEFSLNCMLPPINTFMLEQLHKAAKLPAEFSLNEESGLPEGITYTGLEVYAVCKSEEETQLKDDGEPMINPVTGEPMKANHRKIESFCF